MTKNTLSKLTLLFALLFGMATCSYGFDLWNFVAGPAAPPPSYVVVINNNSTINKVNLSNFQNMGTVPGMPNELDPGASTVLYLDEMSAQNFLQTLDYLSTYHPESVNLDCPATANSHYTLDFNYDSMDLVDPAIIHNFLVHTELCMIQKCDLTGNPYGEIMGLVTVNLNN